MIRTSLLAAALVLTLAACGQNAPAGDAKTDSGATSASSTESTRAPSHPSQSAGAAIGETRQIQITDENRRLVEGNIRDMLGQATTQFGAGGQPMAGVEDVVTAIQPGTDYQYAVNLQGGARYVFVGVCDADCNNIDLELLDSTNGAVVASDLLDDDVPVVPYAPTQNGRYFVRLILRNCAQSPCYIGGRAIQAP